MSCVMSRPSPPPTVRMKLARDFLYWLNHCSWHAHKHGESHHAKHFSVSLLFSLKLYPEMVRV